MLTLVSLGATVRTLLGPLAGPVTNRYRDFFINLDDLAVTLASLAPGAQRVAEIGTGFGDLANALLERLPNAVFYGVDVAHPSPGSLYSRPNQAVFTNQTSSELLTEQGASFDLVLICDVIHHVPCDKRQALLQDAMDLTAPGGVLVVKEWARDRNLRHLAAYVSDYYISADKGVRFETDQAMRRLVDPGQGWSLVCEARVPPARNNVLWGFRKDR